MSFHEVSFGAYRWIVLREIHSIVKSLRLDITGIVELGDKIEREAVDRLYVKGVFHDIMIRWPKKERVC